MCVFILLNLFYLCFKKFSVLNGLEWVILYLLYSLGFDDSFNLNMKILWGFLRTPGSQSFFL